MNFSGVRVRKWKVGALRAVLLMGLAVAAIFLFAQDRTLFPDGFDGVLAAPNSHKVVFENAFVRV